MQRLLHLRSAPQVSVLPTSRTLENMDEQTGKPSGAVRDYLKLDFRKLSEGEASRVMKDIDNMLLNID